jgi:hypothetical protein
MENQLDVPLANLRAKVPQDPLWGVKKNIERRTVFWNGYKAKLANPKKLCQNILTQFFEIRVSFSLPTLVFLLVI